MSLVYQTHLITHRHAAQETNITTPLLLFLVDHMLLKEKDLELDDMSLILSGGLPECSEAEKVLKLSRVSVLDKMY